ncbi:hypothetical protein Tco_0594599, partial [Tanacetum coccineum]
SFLLRNFLSPVESCQQEMVLLWVEEMVLLSAGDGSIWMIVLDTAELRHPTPVPKDHYLVDRTFPS